MIAPPLPPVLDGRRILVVEDELMIADMWGMALVEAGCKIVGPFPRVGLALGAIARETVIDAAVLDVQVRGENVLPVADALAEQGIPFLFTTGYGPSGVPAPHRGRPILTKPCSLMTFLSALAELLGAARGIATEGG
jgi:CheY-like chemotaxis protein